MAFCQSSSLEISSFSNKKCRHIEKIIDHYYNHGVTLILPGENAVPQAVRDSFAETFSYKLIQLPVHRLLEVPFICAFVKRGDVYLLSHGTKLDAHDCAAVTPTGFLLLHLTKDTYQELGLDALPQTHLQKKTDTYLVKIDLKAKHFHPGKKGYDRAMKCLKERLDMKFDFLLSWVPHATEVCSSSVGVYFSDLCDRVECIEPRLTSHVLSSVPFPKVCASDPQGETSGCHFTDVFEWIGALACQTDILFEEINTDNYASSFSCPEPNANCPRCCIIQVKGFLQPNVIIKLLESVKKQQTSVAPPSLTVHGFKDSPVVHRLIPHNFNLSGTNLYSFLLLPEEQFWLYTAPAE